MQNQAVNSENVLIPLNVVRWFFYREQEDARSITNLQKHISSLENSLYTSGWRMQHAVVEKNALSAHYDKLHQDYLKLFEAYELLEKRIDYDGLGITNLPPKQRLTSEDIITENV
ncbi:uncharacterized protein PGRI_093230 [Penicillium griseofulvum]|uniref:Uncharacterized protein n=1 Tax=Penicillium patulum TaxID=5078 RepID=A0A135LQU0_PENPA|nr:uncharacterized protein PGRI_093230 [Penicillium griseofulvum]KXG51311.1 hypothetical protein PGRI_093230 [Penicillium griseofulvum]